MVRRDWPRKTHIARPDLLTGPIFRDCFNLGTSTTIVVLDPPSLAAAEPREHLRC